MSPFVRICVHACARVEIVFHVFSVCSEQECAGYARFPLGGNPRFIVSKNRGQTGLTRGLNFGAPGGGGGGGEADMILSR